MNKLIATLAFGIAGADTAVEAVAAPGFVEPAVAAKAEPTPTSPPGSTCICYHSGPPWPQGHFYNPFPEVECNKGIDCKAACPYGGICEAPYVPTTTQAPMHEGRQAQRDEIQKAGAEPAVAVEAVGAPGFAEPAVAAKAEPTPTSPSGSTCTCYHNGPPWPQGHFYNPSPEVECTKGIDCKAACPYGGICEAPYVPTTTQVPMRQKRNVTVVV